MFIDRFQNGLHRSKKSIEIRLLKVYGPWYMGPNQNNRGQSKNLDIFGALDTLKIQYKYTQTLCEDGARDVRVL